MTNKMILIFYLLLISNCSTKIDQGPSYDANPSWSSDGNKIVYLHSESGRDEFAYNTGLYIIDTLGENRQLIIDGDFREPSWNSNNDIIACQNNGDIYTINTTNNELIKHTYNNTFSYPNWSPDDTKIIFFNYSDMSIVYLNFNNEELNNLWSGMYPNWSPDGDSIVFSDSGIWKAKIDSTGFSQLETHFGVNPSWSPDGLKIIYTVNDSIFCMNSDGSNSRSIINGKDPVWAPDSKRIVFSRELNWQYGYALFILNIDTDDLTQITKND